MSDPSPDPTDSTERPEGDAGDLPPGLDRGAGPGPATWPERLDRYPPTAPSPRRSELHRTADALRRIIHRLHASPAPAEELAAAADELEELARRLDAFPGWSLYEGFSESPLAGPDPHAFFDHSPMLGRANPLAPPIQLWAEGDVLRGRGTSGPDIE